MPTDSNVQISNDQHSDFKQLDPKMNRCEITCQSNTLGYIYDVCSLGS